MRRLAIALVILVAVLLAADFSARVVAEHRLGDQVRSSLRLSETPSVHVGGFPFLTHVLSGRVPSVTVKESSFSAHGWSFTQASIELHDVRFALSQLWSGKDVRVRAASATGSVGVDAATLTKAARRSVPGVTVALSGGRATVDAPGLRGPVAVAIRVTGGSLRISAISSPGVPPLTIALPELINGIHFTGGRIEDSTLVVTFDLTGRTISI